MDNLHRLEEIFAHFPGIGPRQARRFVYHILNKSQASVAELTRLIADVRKSVHECDQCHRYFARHASSNLSCDICANMERDHSLLMIVARDSDFESVEKSGVYNGLYFILGGTVPILDKEPENRIRLRSLLERVSDKNSFKEIIISLNTTPEGEHTANIIGDALTNLPASKTIKITHLGRGLSTGAELEYADPETIKNAFRNRS